MAQSRSLFTGSGNAVERRFGGNALRSILAGLGYAFYPTPFYTYRPYIDSDREAVAYDWAALGQDFQSVLTRHPDGRRTAA